MKVTLPWFHSSRMYCIQPSNSTSTDYFSILWSNRWIWLRIIGIFYKSKDNKLAGAVCVYICGCGCGGVFVSMFVWVSVKVSVHCSCICTYNEKVWDSKRESQKSYDSDPNWPTSSTLGDALRPRMPRYHRSLLSCAILANSCDLSSRESQKNSFRALFPLFAQILWGEVE